MTNFLSGSIEGDAISEDLYWSSQFLARSIKEHGAKALWEELKSRPAEYNQLLFAALEQLKK